MTNVMVLIAMAAAGPGAEYDMMPVKDSATVEIVYDVTPKQKLKKKRGAVQKEAIQKPAQKPAQKVVKSPRQKSHVQKRRMKRQRCGLFRLRCR